MLLGMTLGHDHNVIHAQRGDERRGWLTYSRWFTHIIGHPSAADQVQNRESSLVKDQRSTSVP